jgi:ribosomal protein S27E
MQSREVAASERPIILCGACGSQQVIFSSAQVVCANCAVSLAVLGEAGRMTLNEKAINLRPLIDCGRITYARSGQRVMYIWNNQPRRIAAHDSEPLEATAVELETIEDAGALLTSHKIQIAAFFSACQQRAEHVAELGGRITIVTSPPESSKGCGDVRMIVEAHTHEPTDDRNSGVVFRTFRGCPRCGEAHQMVAFWRYARPTVVDGRAKVSHFASCPSTGEPINLITNGRSKGEKIA